MASTQMTRTNAGEKFILMYVGGEMMTDVKRWKTTVDGKNSLKSCVLRYFGHIVAGRD